MWKGSRVFNSKTNVAALSVASNTVLILLKTFVGLSTGSVSILSEAAHSGADLLAAMIAFVAVRTSNRPADRTHPYGHGKVENLSGAIEAGLIFVAAAWIIYESVRKLVEGTHLVSLDLGLIVMLVSVVINVVVSRRLLRVARDTHSIALEADARHLTTDIVTSGGVFVGLLVVQVTGIVALDALIAIGVALLILHTAYDLVKRSLIDLVDTSLPSDERQSIASILNEHDRTVVEYHDLRSRRVGGQRHIDLHLVVDGKKSVEEAHKLCSHLEEHIREALPETDVVIHLEPPSEAMGNGYGPGTDVEVTEEDKQSPVTQRLLTIDDEETGNGR
jgi:cation diffusion facilitator family transporter